MVDVTAKGRLFGRGTRIEYMAHLGAIRKDGDAWYAADVNAGDRGVMLGPHPTLKGWFMTVPDRHPDMLVPVSPGHIEVVTE